MTEHRFLQNKFLSSNRSFLPAFVILSYTTDKSRAFLRKNAFMFKVEPDRACC
jgi:hypothetical protein